MSLKDSIKKFSQSSISTLRHLKRYFTIKNVSYTTLILNIACVIFGFMYLIIPIYNFMWDIFGIILFIALFGNFLLVYLNSVQLNKTSKIGNTLNILCYIFLIFSIMAMLGMLLGNFLISVSYSNINPLFSTVVYIKYFGLLGFGALIAIIDIKNLKKKELWDKAQISKRQISKTIIRSKRILKKILNIICFLTYLLGIWFAFDILFGLIDITVVLVVVAGQFGIFFSFIFLATTILRLKLRRKSDNPKKYKRIMVIGLTTSLILLIPLISVPFTVLNAEYNFTAAFGSDWRSKIPSSAKQYFLKTPYSTPGYFLGIPPKDCVVMSQISFYNGTTGVDAGIKLYFDAYMPLNGGVGLPGQNSTLIRIHGGGWVFGDKGWGNMLQMNKYFAAQGYIVFDIQYGISKFDIDPLTPNYVVGDFSVDDMVRHVGLFIKYLSNHSTEYSANLDSVFISGGSAGGQLACATALAINKGTYTHLFGTNLTIKGLIPFYPANGMNGYLGISGTNSELIHPKQMINTTSPPCLIFQGTNDILCWFRISHNFKDAYTRVGNEKCAIIWMPFGGHACDLYFNGYYNQIFLYYMERFMYLYR